MLTLPKLVTREAQPYVGLRRTVKIPFGDVVGATMPQLFQWIGEHGVEPVGPPLFRYNLIDMENGIEIDFAMPTGRLLPPNEHVVVGTLPAGRYATLTVHGHYDKLMDATAALMRWAGEQGIVWDAEATPQGERFAGRFEVYPNDPREVPNPDDWETEIWIKTRD